MSARDLLSGPIAEALGMALMHLVWQGAVVAAILASLLTLMNGRSANARYLVSCAALMLLLVLAIATGWHSYQPSSGAFREAPSIHLVPAESASLNTTLSSAPATWRDRVAGLLTETHRHLAAIVLVWLIGVLLLSVRLVLTWIRAQRLAQQSLQPAATIWREASARLSTALRLRRVVRLFESNLVDVPTVIGWLRPVILLPTSTLLSLSPQQIEMVLAHELAHIRRHDFFVNLLQAVVETLMFYHPAVWWMSRRVRIERENCCDDMAIAVCGNPLQYARALTRLEELRAAAPSHPALAANGGSLLARIRRLAGFRAESAAGSSRWAAALGVLTILTALIVAPSLPVMAGTPKTANPAPEAPTPAATTVDVTADPADDTPEATDPEDGVQDIGEVFDEYVTPPAPPAPPTPIPRIALPAPPPAPHVPPARLRAVAIAPCPPRVVLNGHGVTPTAPAPPTPIPAVAPAPPAPITSLPTPIAKPAPIAWASPAVPTFGRRRMRAPVAVAPVAPATPPSFSPTPAIPAAPPTPPPPIPAMTPMATPAPAVAPVPPASRPGAPRIRRRAPRAPATPIGASGT